MYDTVLGEGEILYSQILVFSTVVFAFLMWFSIFKRYGGIGLLKLSATPLVLWMVFGTLDFLVTAKGVYSSPYMESNPVIRHIIASCGYFGPALSSFIWISFWLGLSIVFDLGSKPLPNRMRDLIQLWIFYSLAIGHFFAFHSWMNWGKAVVEIGYGYHRILPFVGEPMGLAYFPWIILGMFSAVSHVLLVHARK